jgi:glycosyltransferase involved in cell wall biosynthesis
MSRIDGVTCQLLTFGSSRLDVVEDESGLSIRTLRPLTHLHGHPAHPLSPAVATAVSGFDVVHVHHMRSTPSRVAAVAGRIHVPGMRRRAVVVTDHGLGGGDWFGLLPKLFDRFLTVSDHSATLLHAPREKTCVVWGGVDPTVFSPEPSTPRSGILFVGRLTPHKGLERLIAALPDDVELTVAGTGGHDLEPPENGYVRRVHADAQGRRVHFVGAVDEADLPTLYRSAAVVVMPSVRVTCYGKTHAVSELLGLSAIEAMASATPVVASRLGGLAEVVVDGETGYLVEPGDVSALRERISCLLADPARARAMGAAGRQRVLRQFTWDACAHRCVAQYREVLS